MPPTLSAKQDQHIRWVVDVSTHVLRWLKDTGYWSFPGVPKLFGDTSDYFRGYIMSNMYRAQDLGGYLLLCSERLCTTDHPLGRFTELASIGGGSVFPMDPLLMHNRPPDYFTCYTMFVYDNNGVSEVASIFQDNVGKSGICAIWRAI